MSVTVVYKKIKFLEKIVKHEMDFHSLTNICWVN